MKRPEPARLLTMASFSAFLIIRRYLQKNPGLDAVQAIEALINIDASFSSMDYTRGLALHHAMPAELDIGFSAALQSCLASLIRERRPPWQRLFPAGRQYVRSALHADELQCFEAAGLFETPVSPEAARWWYEQQALVRSEDDIRRSLQGGRAEMLTLKYERRRLASLGINRDPEWTGLDRNGAGYDIKSYDPGSVDAVARLIEVKSSTAKPPSIFLPRTEWDAALRYGGSFYFYVWALPEESVSIIPAAELASHLPSDRGDGKWNEVIVEIHRTDWEAFSLCS